MEIMHYAGLKISAQWDFNCAIGTKEFNQRLPSLTYPMKHVTVLLYASKIKFSLRSRHRVISISPSMTPKRK